MYRFDSHLHQAGRVLGEEALPRPGPAPLEAMCMGGEPSSHRNTVSARVGLGAHQILQRVVTGQEAQVSRVTTAFPLMPSQPPSSRAQLWETQWAAGSLLPSPRMPVG